MKSTKPRYINASNEAMAKLAKIFNCTEKYVYMALSYRQDSETARKIRFTAVNNFGAVPMCHLPECETWHDVSEDGREIMRQVFNNGAVLRVDKHTAEAWVCNRSGREVVHFQRIDFPELTNLQVLASNL